MKFSVKKLKLIQKYCINKTHSIISAKKRKILFLSSWYPSESNPMNGIFIRKHIELIKDDFDTAVIHVEKKSKTDSECGYPCSGLKGGIMVYESAYFPSGSHVKVIGNISNFLNYYLSVFRCFKQYLKDSGKPDLLSVQVVYPAGIFAIFLNMFYGIPYVISEHWSGYSDEDGRFEKLPGYYKTLFRKTFKNSKGVSAVSEYLAGLIKSKKLYSREIKIIPNVVIIPDSPPVKRFFGDEVRILSISVLDDKTKNISQVISVFCELCGRYDNLKLNIYGDGSDRKSLEELAEKNSLLNSKIFFHGNFSNSEIGRLYSENDFFILNSNFETFSIVTAEAVANGLPAAVTKCGGPEEFIDENSGAMINVNDPADLKSKMEFMILNFRNFDAVKMNQNMKLRYSNEATKKRLVNFFLNAMNDRG